MRRKRIRLLDVVALTEDLRRAKLKRGQVGTVVERLSPNTYEVEFSDNDRRTYASAAIAEQNLMILCYDRAHAA